MAIVRSYTNAFEVVDYTQELLTVPNSWTLLGDTGLFQPEPLTTATATFEQVDQTLALVADQFRGAKPQANLDDSRKIHSYYVPSFPLTDAVLPADIQGKRAYGASNAAETEAAVIARKMARIAKAYDTTLELARFKTLTTLTAYAPNGTVAANFATDFGITQTSVDFVLGTATTDIMGKVESVIAAMQDNANTGDVIAGVVAYCSPEWFAKFISHAKVQTAYQYFSATEGQMILRNRAGGNNGLYREFQFGGIRFIEVRTVLAGQRMIPVGEVVFVPTGVSDVFMTYFSPANKMDFVNTVAEQRYMFTYRDPKGEGIQIEAESSFLNIVRRPQLVVKGVTSN
jgi:hypothetical protein